MMRVSASKDGEVRLDLSQKLPGRGAYLCYRHECVEKARKRDLIRRALKCSVPEEVWVDIENAVAGVPFLENERTSRVLTGVDCTADAERKRPEGVDRQEE